MQHAPRNSVPPRRHLNRAARLFHLGKQRGLVLQRPVPTPLNPAQYFHFGHTPPSWSYRRYGLLYVGRDRVDLHHHLQTVTTPFNVLGQVELCSGSVTLEKLNESLRSGNQPRPAWPSPGHSGDDDRGADLAKAVCVAWSAPDRPCG